MEEEIKYPYIVFKLEGTLYCISSKYITSLLQLPHYTKVSAAPANITGIFRYRDSVIQMVDLRTTLGMKPLVQEYEEFSQMIDDRKRDHVHWVEELERTALTGESFTLARDPHQCALGRWYDSFTANNTTIEFHLKKLEEPHRKLHGAADDVDRCSKDCDSCKRSECLKTILDRVKNENMPLILSLLDQTKDIFASTIYKEMVLLMAGTRWGLVVDEVVGVGDLRPVDRQEFDLMDHQSLHYISNVMEGDKQSSIIFELNVGTLFKELDAAGSVEEMV